MAKKNIKKSKKQEQVVVRVTSDNEGELFGLDDVSESEDSEFNPDSMSDIDFDDSDAEVEYWGRKLGLSNPDDPNAKKRVLDEYEKEGLGEDFLDLFEFVDSLSKEKKKSKKVKSSADPETPETAGKYIPPHLRNGVHIVDNAIVSKKSSTNVSLTGLLNRVSEGNLDSISADIITLISKNKLKPYDIANALVGTACNNPNMSITLQATFSAIACAIAIETAPSNHYSGAILAVIVKTFHDRISTASSELDIRTCMNLVRFTSILFSLGLLSAETIQSMIRCITNYTNISMENKLDLILTCLRFSGRVLRDNHKQRLSTVLSETIAVIERQQKSASVSSTMSKKVEFLTKELKTITRSNFRAVDHLQTACHWLSTRSSNTKRMMVTLGEGGSTLTGWKIPKSVENVQLIFTVSGGDSFGPKVSFPTEWTEAGSEGDVDREFTVSTSKTTGLPSLEELATLNRMTTEIKKNTFIAIMGAVDADHAIMRLDQYELLKGTKNIPSIVSVLSHCAMQETNFNQFYSEIIVKLCSESGSRITLDQSQRSKYIYEVKREFKRLISGGTLDETRLGVLSQMIAHFVKRLNLSMEDILS